ncbi:Uncharacterized protein APZ42_011021 [Daphnia magna]|uniref:Uncharacterized protein n=1 Tax=Daphnia magna TaxID=35525 RepID=A0A162T3V9_9CRUS|nr:Uncharacterized protein APZ42_011021 [Daphnia magna]
MLRNTIPEMSFVSVCVVVLISVKEHQVLSVSLVASCFCGTLQTISDSCVRNCGELFHLFYTHPRERIGS